MSLTLEDYVNHYKKNYPPTVVSVDEAAEVTASMWSSARSLIASVNLLLVRFGEERIITSGWRPLAVNKLIPGAALRSNHIRMCAVDLEDHDGRLDNFCLDAPKVLEDLRLWQEHPSATKGWCHLQNMPYGSFKSGKPRWFYP